MGQYEYEQREARFHEHEKWKERADKVDPRDPVERTEPDFDKMTNENLRSFVISELFYIQAGIGIKGVDSVQEVTNLILKLRPNQGEV